VTVRAEGAFPGRLASFGEVRVLAERFGATMGADHDTTRRLVLILEELFTNTVTHGYPAGAEGPIWVALAARKGTIEVTYEDAAPAFDPFTEAPARPEPALAIDASVVGGLGLMLVRALSASACYARVDDRNRVILTVSIGGTPPPSPVAA
jgi:anti-sigma regulatory factor (Ser/Thr protein kinase)